MTNDAETDSSKGPRVQAEFWQLRLYVAGQMPKSMLALANLKRHCEQRLPGRHKIDLIDVNEDPGLAGEDQVVVVPTLMRTQPAPILRIPGDLADLDLMRPDLRINAPGNEDATAQALRDGLIDAVVMHRPEVHLCFLEPTSLPGRTHEGGSGQQEQLEALAASVRHLKEAEQALREADRRKDEFLATLAHELRNPLAPLRNGLYLMRVVGGDRDLAAQAVNMMDRQLTHLIRLVDDLMDVSRISRGKIDLQKEAIYLADAVNSAVETSRPMIEQMGHHLSVALPDQAILVEADLIRLAQVFTNLLNNAAKYTEHGGQIWFTVELLESEVMISVKDTGIGIAGDHLPRLFSMFFQLDHSLERSQGGLGIGLMLVQRLVEMHGGRIEARSDGPGKGSEFVIHLPLAQS